MSSEEFLHAVRTIPGRVTAPSIESPAARFEPAAFRPRHVSALRSSTIDSTETVEGTVLRVLAAPIGQSDVMVIQVDESTVTTSVVGYTVDGGVALPTSIAAIHSEPALEMSLELYLGSGEIQSLGGEPLEEYEFLEIVQSTECIGALLVAVGATAHVLIELQSIRNPLKWVGFFPRLRAAQLVAAGSMLLAKAACDEDET